MRHYADYESAHCEGRYLSQIFFLLFEVQRQSDQRGCGETTQFRMRVSTNRSTNKPNIESVRWEIANPSTLPNSLALNVKLYIRH